MQLIKKIEINYLRSLYTCTIKNAGDLNVIFGRNDSGKSNLLRALNLFFNELTDLHTDLDFDIDLSDARRTLAREAKGRQFIWIKVTFNVPTNYENALGKEISVKRQWNRDGELTQTESPKLKTSGQNARLSRFLGDIDFTYIPAIKDLEVYADLVERMYASAAESSEIVAATKQFVDSVGEQSKNLTAELTELFGSKTSLSAPTDMSTLFRSLDFAHGEDGHSLFKQKGDGIKARHIPEILRFINDGDPRKKFYLWGIEEPENSLDLSAAGKEAVRLAKIASSDTTQIFVTSHSPAFYLIEDNPACNVRRIFIRKQELIDGNIVPDDAVEPIDDIEAADSAMAAAGLMELPHVIRNLSGLREKAAQAEVEAQALREMLNNSTVPRLFVEGKHDVTLFRNCMTQIVGEGRIEFSKLGGTPSTTSGFMAKLLSEGGINAKVPTMFLFDNDQAGRKAFKNLTGEQYIGAPTPTKIAINTFVSCLSCTNDLFKNFLADVGLSQNDAIFEAEFLFDSKLAASTLNEILKENDPERQKIHEDYFRKQQDVVLKLQSFEAGTPGWFFARTVPDRLKTIFVEKMILDLDQHPDLRAVSESIGKTLLP